MIGSSKYITLGKSTQLQTGALESFLPDPRVHLIFGCRISVPWEIRCLERSLISVAKQKWIVLCGKLDLEPTSIWNHRANQEYKSMHSKRDYLLKTEHTLTMETRNPPPECLPKWNENLCVKPYTKVTGQKSLELTKPHSNCCHKSPDPNWPIPWPLVIS